MKTSLIRAVRPVARSSRLLSTSARTMAEGDVGSPKGNVGGQTDAFQKREEANEAYYIKQKEREKLQQLKAKLDQHEKTIQDLKETVNKMENK